MPITSPDHHPMEILHPTVFHHPQCIPFMLVSPWMSVFSVPLTNLAWRPELCLKDGTSDSKKFPSVRN